MAETNRDFPIAPDSYLYLQNIGSGGVIAVRRGPTVVTQSGQELPVRFDPERRRFLPTSNIEQAVVQFPHAGEGDYVVLENPSVSGDGKQFPSSNSENAIELAKGRRIVIPGPWSEALWPSQIADVIEGHRLRSNQFLNIIIYNAKEAEKNWDTGIIVEPQTEPVEGEDEPSATAQLVAEQGTTGLPKPTSFAVGTRIRISGEDVSFFIPCTGVEVLKDPKTDKYVRDAVTLEQMEYCCLIGEDGKKKYPKGPKVVFPEPTQIFDEDRNGRRKFRPLELNTINGIHCKVTADFEDEDYEKQVDEATGKRPSRKYLEGEELFIKGTTLAIYYPREELAIIEYGRGQKKHFSTAIPKGEGRYLIDREKGSIELIRGPKMLLPDPRTQILVRRILSPDECGLMYPGNQTALAYNLDLAQVMAESPSGRSGVVSEGDYRKVSAKRARKGGARTRGASEVAFAASMADMGESSLEAFGGPEQFATEEVSDDQGGGTSVTRGTKYTEPRSLTLNTKYDGAVKVEVWPGYAILVVGSEGNRRVVEGPEILLLEYDEKLGHMDLSTGKPKSTDDLLPTAYLCVQNNQVGDIIAVESSDHVRARIKISLRVNFEGETEAEKLAWFAVDNYIKYLCDHVRSILAGMAKRHTIAEIKSNYIDLTRDAILGVKPTAASDDVSSPLNATRPGLGGFTNGMRVFDVEVLSLDITDAGIATLLDEAQHQVVEANIELEQARKDLETTEAKERISRAKLVAQQETVQKSLELEKEIIGDQLAVALARLDADLKKLTRQIDEQQAREDLTDIGDQARLAREKAEADQQHVIDEEEQSLELAKLTASTEAAVNRFTAAKEGLHETLVALGRDEMAAKLAEACTIENYLSGDNLGSSIANLLSIAPSLKAFFEKAEGIQQRGNGSGRLTQPASST
jgi:major vault protein